MKLLAVHNSRFMIIAKKYQVNCPSCNAPHIARILFYERCFCGSCPSCKTIFMFSRKNKICRKCDIKTNCFLQYPIVVGDTLAYVKEETKDDEDKEEPFRWRNYTLDSFDIDCV